jgi:hypothetical protein
MIEREATVWIASEALGHILSPQNPQAARRLPGRLVRVAPEGYYEVTVDLQGKNYTALLPVSDTAIMATTPDVEVPPIEVER